MKKSLIGILGVLLLGVYSKADVLSGSDKQYVRNQIKQEVSNGATTATDFDMVGKTFYYTFETYTPYPRNEQIADIKKLTRNVCSNPDTLKVINKGAIFDYTYKDKDSGKPLLHFQIILKDCR